MNAIQRFITKIFSQDDKATYRTARLGKEPTRQKRYRHTDRQNHGRGESTARRKLAAASNRINRQRVKGWKH